MKHTKCYIPEYPRPQFVRADWVNLNGEWGFGFGDEVTPDAAMSGKLPRKINVPFTYETKLSGIEDHSQHPVVWYSRKIQESRESVQSSLLKVRIMIRRCMWAKHWWVPIAVHTAAFLLM